MEPSAGSKAVVAGADVSAPRAAAPPVAAPAQLVAASEGAHSASADVPGPVPPQAPCAHAAGAAAVQHKLIADTNDARPPPPLPSAEPSGTKEATPIYPFPSATAELQPYGTNREAAAPAHLLASTSPWPSTTRGALLPTPSPLLSTVGRPLRAPDRPLLPAEPSLSCTPLPQRPLSGALGTLEC
jgi:hypothetical protein